MSWLSPPPLAPKPLPPVSPLPSTARRTRVMLLVLLASAFTGLLMGAVGFLVLWGLSAWLDLPQAVWKIGTALAALAGASIGSSSARAVLSEAAKTKL